ncbi:MAG: sulfotransferase [Colwellia sp.]|nr:sulfotransferase [Colwellia sp.]
MNFNPKKSMDRTVHFYSAQQFDKALKEIQPLLKAFPNDGSVNHLYACILKSDNKHLTAIEYFNKSLFANSKNINAWNDLGCLYKDMKNYDEAINCFEKALEIKKNHPQAIMNLGNVYHKQQRYDLAIEYLNKGIEIQPNNSMAQFSLGNVYKSTNQIELAVLSYKKSIAVSAKNYKAHYNLALTLKGSGDLTSALKHCQQAIQLNPNYFVAVMLMGELHEYIGNIETAKSCYRKSLALSPSFTEAYWSLANLGSNNLTASDLKTMKALETSNLTDKSKIYLFFSLAKFLEEQNDFSNAFHYLKEGNELKRKYIYYQSEQTLSLFNELRCLFNNELFSKSFSVENDDISPIFIIGMPRSGTSLVEQILASHSSITGGGELETSLQLLFDELPKLTKVSWQKSISMLEPSIIRYLKNIYIEKHASLINTTQYFTDKLPFNFALVGFLMLIFPKAKFIHIYKHPLDSCLSCYKQLFTGGQEYSYQLDELALYYKEYVKMIKHWNSINSDNILNISYENLVEFPEKNISSILNFLNLPWQKECLQFQNSRRIVKTASSGQVRQGLYKNSITRWKNYEKDLLPLIDILSEDSICF